MDTPYKIRGTKVTSPYPVRLTPAETRLVFSLQRFFDVKNILPDCYFYKANRRTNAAYDPHSANHTLAAVHSLSGSEYVQIDCLALNERGIFIFESKDHAGWLYGSLEQTNWTAVLSFGKEKFRFYNPIKQNALHVATIAEIFPNLPIFSIIVFGSDSVLKTPITPPPDCFLCTQPGLRSLLAKFIATEPARLTSSDLLAARRTLEQNRIIPTGPIRSAHIESLEQSR